MRLAAIAMTMSAFVSTADAGFNFSAVKLDEGGQDRVKVYAHNDGLGGTGRALESIEVIYSGTPVTFRTFPVQSGRRVDPFNLESDPNFSWVRVHPEMDTAFFVSPSAGSALWRSPITGFTITYATFGLQPVDISAAPGGQFAEFVLPDGGQFVLTGGIAGEIGNVGLIDFEYEFFEPNIPPQIGSPSGARSTGTSRSFLAIDSDGIIRDFTASSSDGALAEGLIITQRGDQVDLDWSAVAAPGIYHVKLLATDSSIQSNNTSTYLFQFSVVPEPASLAALATVAFLASGRRR